MFKGIIEIKKIRVYKAETGFAVVEVGIIDAGDSDIKMETPIIVGKFQSIFVGDELYIEGVWNEHHTYGYQIQVNQSEKRLPQSLKGITAFIQRHVEGVGKKVAEKIVDVFKEETLQIIEHQPAALASVKGITAKKAKHIHDSIFRHKKFEPISMFVLNNGGSYDLALWAYEEYGELAIRVIRDNPYVLMDYDEKGFLLAEKFAAELKIDPYHEGRFKYGIYAYLQMAVQNRGDLYVNESEIYKELNSFLANIKGFDLLTDHARYIAGVKLGLKVLQDERKIVVRDVIDSDTEERAVYLQKYFFIEHKIVEKLKNLLNADKQLCLPEKAIDDWITKFESNKSSKFALKQKAAIKMALTKGVSILTGGPGTGKTHTINAIIQCVLDSNPYTKIQLLAPTGKASRRMTELTNLPAETIHRGIGLKPGSTNVFTLDSDLVIVDEFSMTDAYVCAKLLEALQEGSSLLIVGDVDQLPSVGAGLILRDLIDSGVIPTTKLDEIFRQAQDSQIVMNAHRLINGCKTTSPDGLRWDHSKGDFYFVEDNTPQSILNKVIESVKRQMNKYGHELKDIQVLTPIHKGVLGTWNLNRALQAAFNPPTSKKAEVNLNEVTIIREGDKVIHLENNDELDVMNGEVGVVDLIYEDVDKGVCIDVEYDNGKIVTYSLNDLEQLDLAYALTVHKCQGSEYAVVISVFHDTLGTMLNRNMVYTLWTRAKKVMINIGNVESLDKAVERIEQIHRNSQIQALLKEKLLLEKAQ